MPLVTRHACLILKAMAGSEAAEQLQPHKNPAVCRALTRVLCGSSSHLQDWFSAAEAAIKAVYAVHPAPQVFHTMLWSCSAPWHTSLGPRALPACCWLPH